MHNNTYPCDADASEGNLADIEGHNAVLHVLGPDADADADASTATSKNMKLSNRHRDELRLSTRQYADVFGAECQNS
jgi:hypothetical protein